jgi:transposase
LVFNVRPHWNKPRCGCCGRLGPRYDRREERHWRHLSVGETVLWLRYTPWRVACRCCGVTVEQVPWARRNSRFIVGLEEWVAYLVPLMDRTAITRLVGISWRAVTAIVERIVAKRLPADRLSGLRAIGVDELSTRAGQARRCQGSATSSSASA